MWNRWTKRLFGGLAVCAAGLGIGSCDSSDGELDDKGPFGAIGEAAVATFSVPTQTGAPGTGRAVRTGETRVVGGVAFPIWDVHREGTPQPSGALVWLDWRPRDETVVFAGGQLDWPDNGVVPAGTPFISGDLDAPVTVTLAPPIGVAQPITVSGTAAIGDPAAPQATQAFSASGSYTLVAEGETAVTDAGPIAGCRRYEGELEVLGETHHATAWYHPDLGLVAADLDWPPPNGVHADLGSLTDLGTAGDMTVLKGLGQVDSARPTFGVDTYDIAGAFDADKTIHARMLIEVRWVDEVKALAELLPPVVLDFGTPMGWFPSELVASPVSLFHPDENGRGFHYGVAYVSQAAKNEPGEGTAYHAKVTLPDYASSAVRVTARIIYRRLP